jgi:hypothetical protein
MNGTSVLWARSSAREASDLLAVTHCTGAVLKFACNFESPHTEAYADHIQDCVAPRSRSCSRYIWRGFVAACLQ